MAIRLYYNWLLDYIIRSRRVSLIAESVLRTSSAISSYTTRAHGIIVNYNYFKKNTLKITQTQN
jgi:hypothetical protein